MQKMERSFEVYKMKSYKDNYKATRKAYMVKESSFKKCNTHRFMQACLHELLRDKCKVFFDIDCKDKTVEDGQGARIASIIRDELHQLFDKKLKQVITFNIGNVNSCHLIFPELCCSRVKLLNIRKHLILKYPELEKWIDAKVYKGEEHLFRLPYAYKGGEKGTQHISVTDREYHEYVLNYVDESRCIDEFIDNMGIVVDEIHEPNSVTVSDVVGLYSNDEKGSIMVDLIENIDEKYSDGYEDWITVLMAIKHEMAEDGIDIARQFSMKSKKHKEGSRSMGGTFLYHWHHIRGAGNGRNYTMSRIMFYSRESNNNQHERIMAKHNFLDKLHAVAGEKEVNDFIVLDKTCFDVSIFEHSKWVCDGVEEADMQAYNECKFKFIWADMGKGKSVYLEKEIQKTDCSILVLSSRQTFSYHMYGLLKGHGFKNYLEVKNEDYGSCHRLIIQMESLKNLPYNMKYDMIIMDEVESLLMQFSSATMRQPDIVWDMFKGLIQKSSSVFCCDAFILNRSVQCMDKLRCNGEKIGLIHNVVPRHAGRVLKEISIEANDKLIKLLNDGKKVYYPSSLRGKLLENLSMFKEKELNALFYDKSTNPVQMKELLKINETWDDKHVIQTTPKITVGVSYTGDNFDCVLLDASNTQGAVCRDICQMLLRCREVNDNIIYAQLPSTKPMNGNRISLVKDMQDFDKLNDARIVEIIDCIIKNTDRTNDAEYRESLKQIKRVVQSSTDLDESLKWILLYNARESGISQLYGRQLLTYFFTMLGYDIQLNPEKAKKAEKKAEKKMEDFDYEGWYDDIEPIISYDECMRLDSNLSLDENMEQTQNRISKYYFENMWAGDLSPDTKAKLFKNCYIVSQKRHLFDNVRCEKSKEHISAFDMLIRDCKRSPFVCDINMTACKLRHIQNLCETLGIKNSHDTKTIFTADEMGKAREYLKDNKESIEVCFSKSGSQGRLKINVNNPGGLTKNIQSIFTNWCGVSPAKHTENKHKKSGDRYVMKGLAFMEEIRGIKPIETTPDFTDEDYDSDDNSGNDCDILRS
jgi:hypothetical protein